MNSAPERVEQLLSCNLEFRGAVERRIRNVDTGYDSVPVQERKAFRKASNSPREMWYSLRGRGLRTLLGDNEFVRHNVVRQDILRCAFVLS